MVVKSVFIFATDKPSIFSENWKNALVEEYKNTLYLKRFYVLYKLSCLILDSFQIRDTKESFHAKMGSINDRNCIDLIEAEDIKKGWQEYTEELYKKDLHDPDNHDGVITHLEPDILECEVKWALGNITTNKASGGDGIPVELFQILKDDAVKELQSICQQIWKTQ